MLRKSLRRSGYILSTFGLLLTMTKSTGSAGYAGQDPGGNNGFVKVDGTDMDNRPDNDPHPGCTFVLEFYNYDQGDLMAEVSFDLQPPTTRQGDDQNILKDNVAIGEDPAGGGADLDARRTYELDIQGADPQPNQGYHVKLTVNAEGSKGNDVKHKTFWVECETTTPTTAAPTTPTTAAPTTPTTPAITTGPNEQVEGTTETAGLPAPEVLGETETRKQALPGTGPQGDLLWVGIGSLAMGLALLGASRRPVAGR